MNILPNSKFVPNAKLKKLPLGCITAKGWFREQLLRNKNGIGGHMDDLEPEMIANPFISYSAFDHLPFMPGPLDRTFTAGWSGEISGAYWLGLVQLAFTLNDEELIKKADRWVEQVMKHVEPDGYLGSYPADTNRLADFNQPNFP